MGMAYLAAILAAAIAFAVAYFVRVKTKRKAIPKQKHELEHSEPRVTEKPELSGQTHTLEQVQNVSPATEVPLVEVERISAAQEASPLVKADEPVELGLDIQSLQVNTELDSQPLEDASEASTPRQTKDAGTNPRESREGSEEETPEPKQKTAREPKQVSPEKRGGRSRVTDREPGEPQTSKAKPRASKPEVVCWKKEREWILALETPEEVNATSILQGNLSLSKETAESDCWRLASLAEEVIISTSQGSELTVVISTDSYLLFKLSGMNQDTGRRVGRSTSGAYLVVAPAEWTRDEASSGPPPAMPEYVSLEGYRAHFFNIERSTTAIAFRDTAGRAVVVASCAPRFRLIGRQLQDAAENLGPLFGGSPPRMGIANGSWDDVGTIVVGTEGGGSDRWRTSFTPSPALSEQPMPLEAIDRKVGWYFVRLYDLQDELIDSFDFRFATGLQKITSHQGSPVPSSTGHSPIVVELEHEKHWQLRSHLPDRSQIRVERSHGQTKLVIPALQECDLSRWLFGPVPGPSIEVTILAERIWWAIGPMTMPPITWQDRCLSLSRPDFASTSEHALWLRFPKSRWANSVFVGFQPGRRREYLLRVSENILAIPLRDFSDSQELAAPSECHDLKVWLCFDGNSYEAAIGTLPSEFLEEHLDLTKCSASRLASALTAVHRLSRGPVRQLAKEVRCGYGRRGHLVVDRNLHFREEALCVIALFFQLQTPLATPKRLNRYRLRTRLASKQFPETMRQIWRRYKELTCSSPIGQPK